MTEETAASAGRFTLRGIPRYIGLGLSAAVLLIVVMLAAIVIVIPRLTNAIPLTVLTSSMEPSLPPGTLIVVRPVDPDDLAIGDVATYQIVVGEPAVITHRISGITSSPSGRTFEFTGDNNSDPDPDPVLPDQIQGRVWYSVPFIGAAGVAFNSQNGSWVVPVAAVLLLAYAGYMLASGAATALRRRRQGSARGRRSRR